MIPDFGEKKVAITGIGQSEVARPSAKSALRLTLDACMMAIADAGLEVDDIDGLANFPGNIDNGNGFAPVGNADVRLALGLAPTFYAGTSSDSPGQLSALIAAANAIAAGAAKHVLIFRTMTEATARAANKHAIVWGGGAPRMWGMWQWPAAFNSPSPTPWFAMFAQRYMHDYGTTPEQLGQIAVHDRRMAALNPNAIYRDPITIEDYLASRMISSPLRIFDCDVPVDGSTALVLSRRDLARDLRNPTLFIEAVGGAMHGGLRKPDELSSFGGEAAAAMMWSRTTLKPSDVDVAQIYDGYSILTLHWLEAMGFCGRGEAGAFVEGGSRMALDGDFPMNTSGGQLSAGRLHGFGHLHEACVQLWGRGGARQVAGGPQVAAVSNGGYGLGCLLLVRE